MAAHREDVLLSRITALGTGPVSDDYLTGLLPGQIDLERIRQDRILHEARISGADPLRLAMGFGIDDSTAMTYADPARQTFAETEPATSTRPRRPVQSQVHGSGSSIGLNPRGNT